MKYVHEFYRVTFLMDYFDRDASFSGITRAEEETYIAIQNILCDERNGWKQPTYSECTPTHTSYTIPILQTNIIIQTYKTSIEEQETLIDSLQKMGNTKEKELNAARVGLVDLLNQLDTAHARLTQYTIQSYLEKVRYNTLHNISYHYKVNGNKDVLVEKTKALMNFLVSNTPP